MISRVRLVRFKRFDDQTFDLTGDSIVLAGPNNSGKSTVLHAVSAWDLALRRWQLERGSSSATRRISIVLDEFTALPLREMNLLWLNRHTARIEKGAKRPKAAPAYVEVEVAPPNAPKASLAIEFLYANEKLVYVRPVKSPDDPAPLQNLPEALAKLDVAHVPPFSGLGTQEARHSIGMQKKLVGEGRAGEIVRNLLLDIWNSSDKSASKEPWSALAADVERLFQFELLPPEFSETHPYIVAEYRPKLPSGKRGPKLDIANAGSGFHQVLLLLSFFYSRPSSVLLLDEPDAHLHFILQREIADHLRLVASRRHCKLIIATHAEVLLNNAEPDNIVSFVGPSPKRLLDARQKRTLTDALEVLTSLDLLQADQVGAVLYVEDDSDQKILREWAQILNHPAQDFLKTPFVWPLKGKTNLGRAFKHFECLKLAFGQLKGICVLDRDSDPSLPTGPRDLEVVKWKRYEIENYLINLELLRRYLKPAPGEELLSHAQYRTDIAAIERRFTENFPAQIDWMGDLQVLRDIKGSDFIVETLALTSRPLAKRDLYMLAAESQAAELPPDIHRVLDAIASRVPLVGAFTDANGALADPDGVEDEPDATGDQGSTDV